MAKKYFILFLFVSLFSLEAISQEQKPISANKNQEPAIDGLAIYPNPTNSGKIYITSKAALDKKIEIFDVLGKKVFETTSASKEINVSSLTAGVYIIKVKEGEATATRKLIVN
ncbi:T9SS type A sorting domain-containing protein [Flavobacterium tibetense]|uniref:T9SS C-terminal target domain-containing protein n=1 Tax=Flavobacterium tibetense TaxID=2233533 RepID=A0A365P5P7_9FLAO|nr:T9SS type A sorting domain-containing protein [Flavobacterium tibetense]RBA29920.1 T9SS C-terminal target domain-containing protein [Flavobacterium tibetense]